MKRNKRDLCKMLLGLIIFAICFMCRPHTVQAATVKLTAPKTVNVVISSGNSMKITWSKVKGADAYQIYQATSAKGNYQLVYSMASGKYNYTNKNLLPGKTYYYKIRAYKKFGKSKIYSSYSKVLSKTIKPTAVSLFEGNLTSYESADLSWGWASYASGYEIYMADFITGDYVPVKQTTDNYCNITELEPGNNYNFKVRSFMVSGNSKVYGEFSKIITITPILPVPDSITATSAAQGVMDISWEPSEGADGYELYQSLSKSEGYQLLTTVSETAYTQTGLNPGSSYYYQLRSYRMVGDTKVYSQYSPAAEVLVPNLDLTEVSLDQSNLGMVIGGTEQLAATTSSQNSINQKISWISSDETVAVVDESGLVSAIGEGNAIISVIAGDSAKKAECNVTVEKANISGIDVSKWQGNIDWSKVKNDGVAFAMLRSSYGSSSLDPKFEINYKGAKNNGIAVGVYHYSHATTVAAAQTEVDFLISTLEGKQFEYPICLDLEDKAQMALDKKLIADIALVYFNTLTEAGYYPMLYSSRGWFTGRLYDTSLDVFDRWVAQWSSVLTYTGELAIWQYSDKGSVSGISGNVDLDTSFVDYESKIKWLGLNGF